MMVETTAAKMAVLKVYSRAGCLVVWKDVTLAGPKVYWLADN